MITWFEKVSAGVTKFEIIWFEKVSAGLKGSLDDFFGGRGDDV